MKIFKSTGAKNAFYIGAISSLAYLMCYFGRNILSVIAPKIVATTDISDVFIGTLATANMICYACGQLINGIIGDKIKAKYLVSGGLILAGICNFSMAATQVRIVMLISYSLIGFFFSMLYAPLVKLIAENTHPSHAIRCCLGLSFASLLGSPVAGMVALFFNWDSAFMMCGGLLLMMGVLFYLTILKLEKSGTVKYITAKKEETKGGSIKVLIQHSIIKFTFVSMLTGIIRTSVLFWVPTYLSQYLGFSVGAAAAAYSVMTCVQAAGPYVTNLIVYEKLLKKNMNRMLLVSFSVSTLSFIAMFTIHHQMINMVFLILALMGANGASEIMWSVYCPSLRDTGMVSTATGYLDAVSYGAAAIANLLFANAISQIGWGKLILVWAGIMVVGVILSIPWRQVKKSLK